MTNPILSGNVAVVTVGFAGAASSLGSEQVTLAYSGGEWYYSPSDMPVYAGHDLAQAIAAAKTAGVC